MIDSLQISNLEALAASDAWSNQPTIRFIPNEMNLGDMVNAYSLSDSAGILFCGGVSILVFFILLLLVKNREKIYFHYALFLLFMLFYGIIHIRTHFILDPSSSGLFSFNKRLVEPVTIYAFGFYIFFSMVLIEVKKHSVKLHRALNFFGWSCMIYATGYYVLFPILIPIEHSIFLVARAIIFPLSLLFLILIQLHIKSPLRIYFMMGSIAYFLGSLIATLRYSYPDVPFAGFYKITSHVYFEIGIMIEILCFALALGHRIYILHSEKEQASLELINQLSINEKLVTKLNIQLEEEVEERTKEIKDTQTKLYNQEKGRIQAEFEKELAQSEMLARRLQINPHFIFNCLNAIKYLIQSDQNEEASRYLVIFSKFIRLVLDSSQKVSISLKEEMEVIYNYLKLEQKRFDNDFTFEIIGIENPELEKVFIPPLLIQPFAENAIWHGLLNSAQQNKVVKIEVIKEKEHFLIVIDDNGIGRKEANKLSMKKLYKSMGINLTRERIKLYNHKHKNILNFTITDKTDNKGTSLGTKVEVMLQLDPGNQLYTFNP